MFNFIQHSAGNATSAAEKVRAASRGRAKATAETTATTTATAVAVSRF